MKQFTPSDYMKERVRNHTIKKEKTLTKITIEQKEECPICFENITIAIKLECSHQFCELCITKIKDCDAIKCPLCRKKQETVEMQNLSKSDQKIIIEQFRSTQNQYKNGNNFIPFSEIIQDIKNKNIL